MRLSRDHTSSRYRGIERKSHETNFEKTYPPLVWDLLRKALNRDAENITFSGRYSTFDDVFEKYTLVTNYHAKNSLQEDVKMAQQNIARFAKGEIPATKWQIFRMNILPTILSGTSHAGLYKVLDIGGGLGDTYINLKTACPSIQCSYTILELSDTTKQGRELFCDFSDIRFISTLPENERFDIVLLGSSLQYFEQYAEIIRTVCSCHPETIILADHPMGPAETFVCAQVNMRGRVMPMMVFNLDEIIRLFGGYGYDCIMRTTSHYPFHDFENYGNEIAKTKFYNLVFKAKTYG